jgi:peptidoglycan biosynthesis protein MviN/MurJ (putative lipid II flippase)
VAKPSARAPRSTLSSGLLTALSLAVVTGLSAAVGVVIAREFGLGVETDGFFAAYGVFLVLVLAASAVRIAVLPSLARARAAGSFGSVLGSYVLAVAFVAVPALLVGVFANDWTAAQLAGGLPESAQETAAEALVFLVPAAVAQLYAALAASGLAAYDSYATAAAGYAIGSALGLTVILWRVDEDGIVACAWGPLVNSIVTLAIPLAGLALRADWGRRVALDVGSRFAELARAAALPIVLQIFFVVCLRFASGLGTGAVTSFTYAYFVASALVAITASSLGMVSSVPLTRSVLSDERASRHVVSASLVSFAAVAAAAGVFALVGDRIVHAALGPAYEGDAGEEIGRLIVLLGPWMAASIGVTITFPMLFVAGRARRLPLLAIAALLLDVALTWIAVDAFELDGAALALTVSTLVVLAALLAFLSSRVLAESGRRLALGAAAIGALALVSFAAPAWVLPDAAAAVVGIAAFGALLVAVRERGLQQAWSYLRTLD